MEICYLLAFPDSDEKTHQSTEQFKGLKDAPYFQPIDIDLVTLGEETIVIEVMRWQWRVSAMMATSKWLNATSICAIHSPHPCCRTAPRSRTHCKAAISLKRIAKAGCSKNIRYCWWRTPNPRPINGWKRTRWRWPIS